MKPEIELLGISIKTFGVMFALGFFACGGLVARRLRELERPVDWAYEIVFAALIGGANEVAGTGEAVAGEERNVWEVAFVVLRHASARLPGRFGVKRANAAAPGDDSAAG